MATPKLYSYVESGNSYKTRLLAALLHQTLEVVELDFHTDQQHSPEFTKINPRGEVPCLVDGDKIFTDSAAILVWLAGKYPEAKYWSSDLYEQAQIVDWLAFAASWVQFGVFIPRAILSYGGPYNSLGTNDRWTEEETKQQLKESTIRSNKSLEILQTRLEQNQWLVLGRPTIADVAVFVYVALSPMGDIKLEPYPQVQRWIEDIKKLPGFITIPGLEDPLIRRRG